MLNLNDTELYLPIIIDWVVLLFFQIIPVAHRKKSLTLHSVCGFNCIYSRSLIKSLINKIPWFLSNFLPGLVFISIKLYELFIVLLAFTYMSIHVCCEYVCDVSLFSCCLLTDLVKSISSCGLTFIVY